jgi:hypothetical protein
VPDPEDDVVVTYGHTMDEDWEPFIVTNTEPLELIFWAPVLMRVQNAPVESVVPID